MYLKILLKNTDVIFDEQLIFEEHHFRMILSKKKNRNIGLLHNLRDLLIRPCFDYGDFRYEQTFSFSFHQKPAITSLLFQSNSQENFVKLSPTRIRFYYSKFGIVSSKALFFRLRLFHAKA